MSEKVYITWGIDDGYAGGDRPQHMSVDPEAYRGMSKGEIEKDLWDEVREAFQNVVRPVCDVSEYADEILKALEASPEEDEE